VSAAACPPVVVVDAGDEEEDDGVQVFPAAAAAASSSSSSSSSSSYSSFSAARARSSSLFSSSPSVAATGVWAPRPSSSRAVLPAAGGGSSATGRGRPPLDHNTKAVKKCESIFGECENALQRAIARHETECSHDSAAKLQKAETKFEAAKLELDYAKSVQNKKEKGYNPSPEDLLRASADARMRHDEYAPIYEVGSEEEDEEDDGEDGEEDESAFVRKAGKGKGQSKATRKRSRQSVVNIKM
jgi:hypothetical protein